MDKVEESATTWDHPFENSRAGMSRVMPLLNKFLKDTHSPGIFIVVILTQ